MQQQRTDYQGAHISSSTLAYPTAAPEHLWRDNPVTHHLPILPYAYDALEPYLSEELVQAHYTKHHSGYVKELNRVEARMRAAQETHDFRDIRALCRALSFYYSAHVLHSLYWRSMSPMNREPSRPTGAFEEQVLRDFGSLEVLEAQFLAAADAVPGPGWALLVWQPLGEQLAVLQVERHQNLAQWGTTPILALDLWKDAYHLQYGDRREQYAAGFFDVVNWEAAEHRFEAA